MKEIIRTEDLYAGYEGSVVLKELNFIINKGEITVILGKSGCGKSTILKTIIGLIPPISGDIYFYEKRMDYLSESSVNNLYRRIGVLFQNNALLNSLNLYDNVSIPIKMHYPELQKEIEREMVFSTLSQVGLLKSFNKFPSQLSGGMRKRAALARSMILDPDIIFCDEPTTGLDPITAHGLDELMLNLKNIFGITLVVVTHELRSIEKISDKVIVLKDGAVHFSGKYDKLFTLNDSFINKFFLKG